MSRISPVRSITLQDQARSRLRCCTGESAASMTATVTSCSAIAWPSSETCPSPSRVAGRRARNGRMAVCTTTSPIEAVSPTVSARRASAARVCSPRTARWRSDRSHGRITAARIGPAKPFRADWPLESWSPSVASGRTHLPCRDSGTFRLGRVEQLDRRARHYSADGVLVHQLGVPVSAQQNRKVVKPSNYALKLDPVHKEDGHWSLVLSHVVQEHILNILRFLIGHGTILLLVFAVAVLSARTGVARPPGSATPSSHTPCSRKHTKSRREVQ